MTAYFCGSTGTQIEGHTPDSCVPCLQKMNAYLKSQVDVDLLARLREMDQRIVQQRRELALLNAKVAGPPGTVSAHEAFDHWCMPLDRSDRRFAAVCFRSGWLAARRAMPTGSENT